MVALATAAAAPAAPEATIETSLGAIVVRLDPARAPRAVDNFLAYLDEHFYDGSIFHRVIPGFMAQAGGYGPGLRERVGRRPAVPNESVGGAANRRGTLAAARTLAADSARAQFYINLVDNPSLDARGPGQPGYTVFGEVIAGMEVVERIAKVPLRCPSSEPTAPCDLAPGLRDVPLSEVKILSVRRRPAATSPPARRAAPAAALPAGR